MTIEQVTLMRCDWDHACRNTCYYFHDPAEAVTQGWHIDPQGAGVWDICPSCITRARERERTRWNGCVHTIPLHEGWTEDETIRWLAQGLALPDVDPPLWLNVVYEPGQCELPHD